MSTTDKVDFKKWNSNGASGTRIRIFIMSERQKEGGQYGCFSSCCAGGSGLGKIIKNLAV